MTGQGYFSCLCHRIYLSTSNVRNSGHLATVFGAVVEPTQCFTNSCLHHLTKLSPRLKPRTTDLCSAWWQCPSSELFFTTDETLRKFGSNKLPAACFTSSTKSNDSHEVPCATHFTADSLGPTSCRRSDKAHQPLTGGLLSFSTLHGLTDTSLLAYYAKTGVLSRRWLCSTARTYLPKRSDDEDDSYKEKKTPHDHKIDESKLSLIQKFKLMYRQYWYVLLPVHVATSVVWYGSFFIAAKNGVDIVPLLKTLGISSETILHHLQDSNTGYYALAYAMYKVASPARYTVTLGCTTFSINYLKNKGYIKPVPSPEQLKHIYEDKLDEMLERSHEMREQFQVRRDELQDKLDQRRALMKSNFEGRREAIRDRFEERREELKQRFVSSSDRLEERLDQLKQHEDKLTKKASGAFNEMKENLEQKTENIKKKLEGVEQRIAKDVFKTDDDTKK